MDGSIFASYQFVRNGERSETRPNATPTKDNDEDEDDRRRTRKRTASTLSRRVASTGII